MTENSATPASPQNDEEQISHFQIEPSETKMSELEKGDEQPHNDVTSLWIPRRFSSVMFWFLVMGMGPLFPYNSLIASVDYFTTIHPDPNDKILSQIAATSLLSLLLTTCLLTFILTPSSVNTKDHISYTSPNPSLTSQKSKIKRITAKIQNPQNRILMGFYLEFVVFLILAILPAPSIFVCKSIAFVVGTGDALSQSGLYEWAAAIHPKFTAAVTFGCALAGLGVSLLKMVTRSIFPNSLMTWDSKSFFVCNALVVLACVTGVHKAYSILQEDKFDSDNQDVKTDTKKSGYHKVNFHLDDLEKNIPTYPNESSPIFSSGHIHHRSTHTQSLSPPGSLPSSPSSSSSPSFFSLYYKTLILIWKPILAMFLNFFVTLALFPGPITSIVSQTFPKDQHIISFGTWLPIILITSFNLCDCLGRFLLSDFQILSSTRNFSTPYSSTVQEEANFDPNTTETSNEEVSPNNLLSMVWPFSWSSYSLSDTLLHQTHDSIKEVLHLPNFNWMILYPSFLRFLFFPLLYACVHVHVSDENENEYDFKNGFLFSHDMGRLYLVAIFGLSNGFIATACFMTGPTLIPKSMKQYDAHRDAASLLLLLICFLGLTAGGYFALIVDHYFMIE